MPEEWDRRVDAWIRFNERHKRVVNGISVPTTAEEMLVYQTLIGAWSTEPDEEEEQLPDRLANFLVKAAREAKTHSSWLQPNTEHESVLQEFARSILQPDAEFLDDFRAFHEKIDFFGAINALSQLLLKVAAPGIPDIYQGSELWNLSLVDPDNRRPVDYAMRKRMLESVKQCESGNRTSFIRRLGAHPQGAETKLFLTYKALHIRRMNPKLFAEGDYIPLAAQGERSEHVVAFARRHGDSWAVLVVPRWLLRLGCEPPSVTSDNWGVTALALPPEAPQDWQNVLTGSVVGSLHINDLLRDFPVALLQEK
jgi:(1->4)-alpha-D-glucan 1-alpha-D-glucosylmutase